jgi:hypothetical protein
LGLTIGQSKIVSDYTDGASSNIEAVNLVSQPWRWAEVLEEPIEGIGKVEVPVAGVDADVVE